MTSGLENIKTVSYTHLDVYKRQLNIVFGYQTKGNFNATPIVVFTLKTFLIFETL